MPQTPSDAQHIGKRFDNPLNLLPLFLSRIHQRQSYAPIAFNVLARTRRVYGPLVSKYFDCLSRLSESHSRLRPP